MPKGQSVKDILTFDFLAEEYIQKKRSVVDISNSLQLSRSVVKLYLKKFGLIKYSAKRAKDILSKEQLMILYLEEQKDPQEIGQLHGLSRRSISRLLIQYQIPLKGKHGSKRRTEARINGWKKLRGGYQDISQTYWSRITYRAKTDNIPMTVTIEEAWEIYLKQNSLCVLSGKPIVFKELCEPSSTQTASLDRIDSNKGYEPDNVQWIHKDLQFMKSNMTDHEFIEWCQTIAAWQQYKNTPILD